MLMRPVEKREKGLLTWLVMMSIGLSGILTKPLKHRLYWRICNQMGRLVPASSAGEVVIRLAPDSRMKIFLSDPYWSRLIADSYEYEADFLRILSHIKDMDFVFIDCGANFGYWSILLSSDKLGSHSVLSIEASQKTYQILKENCQLNQDRFSIKYAAISSDSGQSVWIEDPTGHAGAHIAADTENRPNVPAVLTTTLDDVISDHFKGVPPRLLVKLDVEGQEINALSAASQILTSDVLFYYEDHGNEPNSKVTQFILEELGLLVFYCPPAGRLKPILTTADASGVKLRKSYGYNFFACKKDSVFLGPLLSA
jgi:FkbM family methyltransferase